MVPILLGGVLFMIAMASRKKGAPLISVPSTKTPAKPGAPEPSCPQGLTWDSISKTCVDPEDLGPEYQIPDQCWDENVPPDKRDDLEALLALDLSVRANRDAAYVLAVDYRGHGWLKGAACLEYKIGEADRKGGAWGNASTFKAPW